MANMHTAERGAKGIWAVVAVLAGLQTILRTSGTGDFDALLAFTYAGLTGLATLQILRNFR